jgi:hypothetical protein
MGKVKHGTKRSLSSKQIFKVCKERHINELRRYRRDSVRILSSFALIKQVVEDGFLDILRVLVDELGVNLEETWSDTDSTVWHYAATIHCLDLSIVHYLVSKCSENTMFRSSGTQEAPFVLAIYNGNFSFVSCTVKEFNAPISEELFVLAVKGNHVTVVDIFLTEGNNANMICQDDGHVLSLLVLAVKLKYAVMARLLVKHGANMDWQTHDGSTALIFAAMNQNLELVKYFVNKGADTTLQSQIVGSVSTILANYLGDWDNRMDYVLTEFYPGTDDDDTSFKRTAISRAFDGGHLDVFRMLIKDFHTDISSIQDELLVLAVSRNDANMVEFLITIIGQTDPLE